MKSTGEPYPQLTLFAADTPANHSAPPAQETAQTTPDTSGHVSPTAFAYFDHDLRCWKTLQGTFLSDSEMSKPIWPRSGMTHNGIAYQRQPSAHRTSAIEYSLSLHETMEWTPTATANQMSPSMIPRNPGLKVGPNSDGLWPTPTTADHTTRYAQGGMPLGMAARLWPTPDASPHKYRLQGDSQASRSLNGVHGGKLNPEWVEWLMGFPIGWTDLEDSETP